MGLMMEIKISILDYTETFNFDHLPEEEQKRLVLNILEKLFNSQNVNQCPQKKPSGKPFLIVVKK